MSSFGAIDLLGFHSVNTVPPRRQGDIGCTNNPRKEDVTYINGLNLLGYIPVVGIATGSYRVSLVKSGSGTTESLMAKILFVVRGIFEIIGAGLVFLPLDLVVTAGRHVNSFLFSRLT